MEAYATEKGATFHYDSPAVQLVRDESGRCTGVIAKNESDDTCGTTLRRACC